MSKTIVCPHCLQTNKIPSDRELTKANCGKCKGSLLDTHPVKADTAAFEKHLNSNDILVVVDFFAEWCGPCKMLAPVYEKVAAQFPLKARFLKMDSDNAPDLSARYGIRGVPTIILYKNGAEVDRVSGALGEHDLKRFVENRL